jgi:hypothetical protein
MFMILVCHVNLPNVRVSDDDNSATVSTNGVRIYYNLETSLTQSRNCLNTAEVNAVLLLMNLVHFLAHSFHLSLYT